MNTVELPKVKLEEKYVIKRNGPENQTSSVNVERIENFGAVWQRRQLKTGPSLSIISHAPSFNFGAVGNGPAQLALGILFDVTGDKGRATRHYQAFKDDFITPLKHPGGSITITDIRIWLNSRAY